MPKPRIIRSVVEELEKFGKTAVEQVVGVPEKSDTSKILPPEEKKKIKGQEASRLTEINRQIEAIRKNKEPKPQSIQQEEVIKKHEEKKKQVKKESVIAKLIRGQQGSKESGNIRASG